MANAAHHLRPVRADLHDTGEYSVTDLLRLPMPEPIVDSLIHDREIIVAVGKPKQGKTWALISIACSVAAGVPVWELAVRRGGVLYLAAEGIGGFGRRIAGWLKSPAAADADRDDLRENLIVQTKVGGRRIDLLDQQIVAGIIGRLREMSAPRLLIVDVLSCAWSGKEVTEQMSELVENLRRIIDATGVGVLVAHHPAKKGKLGEGRGSGVLEGLENGHFAVSKDNNCITVTPCLFREREVGEKIGLQLVDVEVFIGPKHARERRRSCYLEMVELEPAQSGSKSVSRKAASKTVDAANDVLRCFEKDEVEKLKSCRLQKRLMRQGRSRATARRRMKDALAAGVVRKSGQGPNTYYSLVRA